MFVLALFAFTNFFHHTCPMVSWAFLVMPVNTAVHHEMNQVNSLFIFSHVGLWQWWVALLVRLVIAVAQPACPDKLWWHLKVHRGHLSHFPTWQEKNSGWLLKVFSTSFFFNCSSFSPFLFCLFVCFLIFSVLKLDSLCLHGMTQIYPASKSRWRKKDPKTGEHKRHKSYIFYRCEIYSGLSYFKNVHVLLFNKCNQKDKWWFSLAAIKVCTVVVTHLQNGVVFGHFSENMKQFSLMVSGWVKPFIKWLFALLKS